MPLPSFASLIRLAPFTGTMLAALACGESGVPGATSVAPPSVTAGLAIAPASAMLRVGDTIRFSVPRCVSDLSQARWRAGNSSVVSVDSLHGLVMAREVGVSTVQVLLPGCGSMIGPGSVSVIP
jgi:hypothetical protein